MFFHHFLLKILLAALTIMMFGVAACLFLNNSDEFALKKFEHELLNSNPGLAQKYAAIKDRKAKEALRITMQYYRYNSLQAVADFTRDQQRFPSGMPLLKLTEHSLEIANSGGDFRPFLETQSANFQLINQIGSPELLQKYLTAIDEIKKSGSDGRELLNRDPLAVPVFLALKNHPDLWNFYQQNNDCLSTLLAATLIYEGELDAIQLSQAIIAYLKAAQAAPEVVNMLFNAITTQSDAADAAIDPLDIYSLVLPIMAKNSEALKLPQRQKLPLLEFFSVMAINPAASENYPDNKEFGLYLATLRQIKPNLWLRAQEQPGVLELDRRIPAYSEKIMTDFGHCNIATFLLAEYGENNVLLREAGKILVTYGDLGYAVLQDYNELPAFKLYLAKPEVGFKLVPMIGHFKQDTFTKLDDNVAWVDRYFDANGILRNPSDSFLELCPFVGGIATVADNWAKGYPCEWSEIGFAALDVADCALLIASAGGSSGITAAKTAAVSTGKATMKASAKELAESSFRSGLTKGIKRTAGNEMRHPQKLKILTKLRKLTISSAHGIAISVKNVAQPLLKTNAHWRQLKPATRRLIYKITGGAILLHTLMERTVPGMPQYLSSHIAQFADNLTGQISTLPEQIAAQIAQRQPEHDHKKYILGTLLLGGLSLLSLIWLCRRRSNWNRFKQV